MEDKTQSGEEKQLFIFTSDLFQVKLPDKLVRQVMDKVKNLVPVMLDAARPEDTEADCLGGFF